MEGGGRRYRAQLLSRVFLQPSPPVASHRLLYGQCVAVQLQDRTLGAGVAKRESDEKGRPSKPTKSKERSLPIRRRIRVVLWDEPPEDDAQEDEERNKKTSEEHRP